MKLYCDVCGRTLGDYLFGPGGIEERAVITNVHRLVGLPDIECFECFREGKPKSSLEEK